MRALLNFLIPAAGNPLNSASLRSLRLCGAIWHKNN
jgi:hypothetical protein